MNNNLTKKEILERISYFRTKKDITSYKLGTMLGHSKTYFYRIESGEIQLTLDGFLDILETLQITTSEFFCVEQKGNRDELVNEIEKLSPENKKTILDLIKKLN